MAELSREDVLKLVRLARLELSEAEIEEYQSELSQILDYVKQLQQVDTAGLQPTNQVTGLINIMREDEIKDYGYDARKLLDNVAQTEADQIKVKRMVEKV